MSAVVGVGVEVAVSVVAVVAVATDGDDDVIADGDADGDDFGFVFGFVFGFGRSSSAGELFSRCERVRVWDEVRGADTDDVRDGNGDGVGVGDSVGNGVGVDARIRISPSRTDRGGRGGGEGKGDKVRLRAGAGSGAGDGDRSCEPELAAVFPAACGSGSCATSALASVSMFCVVAFFALMLLFRSFPVDASTVELCGFLDFFCADLYACLCLCQCLCLYVCRFMLLPSVALVAVAAVFAFRGRRD